MSPCSKCDAVCCKYVTVKLEDPVNPEDWDEMKWLLIHENIIVYKDNEDEWMVEFITKCKHLEGNRCNNYEKRPDVCKDHDPSDCDASSGEFCKILFKKPEDVDEYLKK